MAEIYREALERALAAACRQTRLLSPAEAARLGGCLLGHPESRRWMLVRNTARYQSPEIGEWLLARCHHLDFEGLDELMDTARTAVEVMESLGPLPVPGLLGDLRAEAWAVLGNAHRVAGDLEAAGACLERAAGSLSAGSGDPLVAARVTLFQGALAVEQRSFAAAPDLFLQASHLATQGGDEQLTARALVSLGRASCLAGRPAEGLRALRASQRVLDAERHPALAALALHSLVLVLHRMGRHEEARRQLRRSWPLYQQIRRRFGPLHFRWLVGRFPSSGASPPAASPARLSPDPGSAGPLSPAPAAPSLVPPARRQPDRILRRRRAGRWGNPKLSRHR